MAVFVLTQIDNGCSIEMKEGDEVIIQLPENPTTGYRWQVDKSDADVRLIDDSFQLSKDPQVGSGGVREFRYRIQSPRGGTIALKLWRGWEGEASIVERFDCKVVPML